MKKEDFTPGRTAGGYMAALPTPTPEALGAFYASIYYQRPPGSTYHGAYSDDERAHIALGARQILYAAAEARGREGGTLLEIGCGEGFLLAEAQRAGYGVLGVDFSSHGLQSFHPELSDVLLVGDGMDVLAGLARDGRTFDVAVLKNVLEHVTDPAALLERLRPVLAPGGVAVITVPNDYSALQAKLRELGLADREYWFSPPMHLNYFNHGTLRTFLDGAGWDVADCFGDFPIEFYLMSRGSNYVLDRACGKDAHKARVVLDLLMAEAGMSAFHAHGRALAACGMGRCVTVVVRSR